MKLLLLLLLLGIAYAAHPVDYWKSNNCFLGSISWPIVVPIVQRSSPCDTEQTAITCHRLWIEDIHSVSSLQASALYLARHALQLEYIAVRLNYGQVRPLPAVAQQVEDYLSNSCPPNKLDSDQDQRQFGLTTGITGIDPTWLHSLYLLNGGQGDQGCTRPVDYWRTHYCGSNEFNVSWPPGDCSTEKTGLLCGLHWGDIFSHTFTAHTHLWFQLAHQYVAASLNMANGAILTPQNAFQDAGHLLADTCFAKAFSTEQAPLATHAHSILAAWNDGFIGIVGHCNTSLLPVLPSPTPTPSPIPPIPTTTTTTTAITMDSATTWDHLISTVSSLFDNITSIILSPVPTPTPAVANYNCTLTQGYWMHHQCLCFSTTDTNYGCVQESWPPADATDSCKTEFQLLCGTTWLSILQVTETEKMGHGWYAAAHVLIAYWLNLNRNLTPTAETVYAAQLVKTVLESHCKDLVLDGSHFRQYVLGNASILDQYNNHGVCDNQEPSPISLYEYLTSEKHQIASGSIAQLFLDEDEYGQWTGSLSPDGIFIIVMASMLAMIIILGIIIQYVRHLPDRIGFMLVNDAQQPAIQPGEETELIALDHDLNSAYSVKDPQD